MDRPKAFWGVNHLKLAAFDIATTKRFYTDILGLEFIPQYEHYNARGELFASMVKMQHHDNEVIIEIRHNPEQAAKAKFWDPITFGVETRQDLETWKRWFEEKGVKCSKVFSGVKGWLVCALDPDEKIVRIYCDESHEWSSVFDEDEFWLR